MMFIVATDVVASRPPKYRLTGTPTAHAKNWGNYQPSDPSPPAKSKMAKGFDLLVLGAPVIFC